jgi:hypothetical protein
MNTNSILVYGERLGDLLAATDEIEAVRRGEPPDPVANATIAPLFRSVARAAAEVLLQLADSARPLSLITVDEHLVGLAYLQVLDEIDDVVRDPRCLLAHPTVAKRPMRRELLAGSKEPV